MSLPQLQCQDTVQSRVGQPKFTHFLQKTELIFPDYVAYHLWQDSEPLISSILYRSRASFKHVLSLANIAGIPLLQQHGSDGINVPAYHSRLMHALLEESDWPSHHVELRHRGRWFHGVMTTALLLTFHEDSLQLATKKIPSKYTIYVTPSGDMTSKGGIYADQLQSPERFGCMHVRFVVQAKAWHIQT